MARKITFPRLLSILFMVFLSIIALFPFYCMLIMGTYNINDLVKGIHLLPGKYIAHNWKTLFTVPILTYYKNSILVAVASMILCVFISTMCGYGIAKYDFKGKKALNAVIMVTLLIPTQLSLIALVIEMRKLGLTGTLWPIILPNGASAFGVYWIISYSGKAVPDEVMESGRIDGCTEFRIFWNLSIPFMKPAIITLCLLSFLWAWNALLTPMVLISRQKLFTLPLGIKTLSTGFRNDYGAQILGLSVGTVPILFLFSFFSKNLISGLSGVAVKG